MSDRDLPSGEPPDMSDYFDVSSIPSAEDFLEAYFSSLPSEVSLPHQPGDLGLYEQAPATITSVEASLDRADEDPCRFVDLPLSKDVPSTQTCVSSDPEGRFTSFDATQYAYSDSGNSASISTLLEDEYTAYEAAPSGDNLEQSQTSQDSEASSAFAANYLSWSDLHFYSSTAPSLPTSSVTTATSSDLWPEVESTAVSTSTSAIIALPSPSAYAYNSSTFTEYEEQTAVRPSGYLSASSALSTNASIAMSPPYFNPADQYTTTASLPDFLPQTPESQSEHAGPSDSAYMLQYPTRAAWPDLMTHEPAPLVPNPGRSQKRKNREETDGSDDSSSDGATYKYESREHAHKKRRFAVAQRLLRDPADTDAITTSSRASVDAREYLPSTPYSEAGVTTGSPQNYSDGSSFYSRTSRSAILALSDPAYDASIFSEYDQQMPGGSLGYDAPSPAPTTSVRDSSAPYAQAEVHRTPSLRDPTSLTPESQDESVGSSSSAYMGYDLTTGAWPSGISGAAAPPAPQPGRVQKRKRHQDTDASDDNSEADPSYEPGGRGRISKKKRLPVAPRRGRNPHNVGAVASSSRVTLDDLEHRSLNTRSEAAATPSGFSEIPRHDSPPPNLIDERSTQRRPATRSGRAATVNSTSLQDSQSGRQETSSGPSRNKRSIPKNNKQQQTSQEKPRIPCTFAPACDKTFGRDTDLNRHLRCSCKFRPQDDPEWVCEVCGKPFSRYDALKRHQAGMHGNQDEGTGEDPSEESD